MRNLEALPRVPIAAMLQVSLPGLPRAGALAHMPCSHTPPALLLQDSALAPRAGSAPHLASDVIPSRGLGRARSKYHDHKTDVKRFWTHHIPST